MSDDGRGGEVDVEGGGGEGEELPQEEEPGEGEEHKEEKEEEEVVAEEETHGKRERVSFGVKVFGLVFAVARIVCFIAFIVTAALLLNGKFSQDMKNQVVHRVLKGVGLVLLGVGVFSLCVELVGVVGYLRQQKCCFTLFLLLVSLSLIGYLTLCGISTSIVVIVSKLKKMEGDVEGAVEKFGMAYWENMGGMEKVDIFQKTFKCCGITGPQNYDPQLPATDAIQKIRIAGMDEWVAKYSPEGVPQSCKCWSTQEGCVDGNYNNGCLAVILEDLEQLLKVAIVTGVISFLLVAGIVLGCMACCALCYKKNDTTQE